MNSFEFKLEKVLEFRKNILVVAETAFSKAVFSRDSVQNILYVEREAYFQEREEMNAKKMRNNFEDMLIYEQSMEKRKQRLMEILQSLKLANDAVKIAEAKLLDARKNFKAIEKLKLQKEKEFNLQENFKEARILDEYANHKFLKNKLSSQKKGT